MIRSSCKSGDISNEQDRKRKLHEAPISLYHGTSMKLWLSLKYRVHFTGIKTQISYENKGIDKRGLFEADTRGD